MTQHKLLNCIRSLYNIEPIDLEFSDAQCAEFEKDPVRFFIRADDATANIIFNAIEARQGNQHVG